MARTYGKLMEALEDVVDEIGVAATLGLLADVCSEKADHLRSNWQDAGTARLFDRAASIIGTTVPKIDKFLSD